MVNTEQEEVMQSKEKIVKGTIHLLINTIALGEAMEVIVDTEADH